MLKNKYFPTALSLYLNYFVQGFQGIIISQNSANFAAAWNTTDAGVFGVIAAVGIGKFIIIFFSGLLSDKFGRKPMAIVGMLGYIVFFGGLMLCKDIRLAYVLAFTAGAATSFLDAATYPGLMEIFPDNSSVASVILKGFVAVSSGLLPLFVGFLTNNNMWFGWSLVVPFVIVCLNFFFMMTRKFPDAENKKAGATEEVDESAIKAAEDAAMAKFKTKPNYAVQGVMLMFFSFFCMSTFYLWQQTATKYAMEVIGMSNTASRGIMTIYSIGTMLSVILTSVIISKGIRDMAILVLYTAISTVTLLTVYLFPSQITMTIASFIIGFFTAGGILQIGNALLSQFFPKGKGRNTSAYNVFMASAAYVMPALTTGLINNNEFAKVLLLEVGLSAAAFTVVFVLSFFYKKVFGKSAFSKTV